MLLGLYVLCVLEFLVLVLAFLSWFFLLRDNSTISLLMGILLLMAIPLSTFYFFRRKATVEINVIVSASELKIYWPSKKRLISLADIESYGTSRIGQDTYDRETVRIRLRGGDKIKFTATSDICDIEPLRHFRVEFDELAQTLKIQKKNTWEERLLGKREDLAGT